MAVEESSTSIGTNKLWGECRITAYCACEKCCGKWAKNRPINPDTGLPIVKGAAGTELQSYYSVAANLPFGTKLYIPELDMEFEVADRTAQSIQERYKGMVVDIFINDHQACWDFIRGMSEYMDVYIVEEEV